MARSTKDRLRKPTGEEWRDDTRKRFGKNTELNVVTTLWLLRIGSSNGSFAMMWPSADLPRAKKVTKINLKVLG